ncbi:bifunctional transcriptional activator/DNA repair enzyme AdaA [Porticoccaceae bacterium]|nr:bifunctional transcriptional activator/DNA repair enzyme AdaA [Porticoccaceae bacterium]
MLFDLPNHHELYQALLKRDPRFDGQTYVAVLTTGVFCRLICPARKPKPENCNFYSTVAECIEAGFRPCKRCHPLRPNASANPSIVMLLQGLEERPEHRWREGDIEKMGFDLSTVRRCFKRQYGMTFLKMARQRRLRDGFEALSVGGRVIDAQMDARFESASAFRLAFAGILGCAPGHLKPNAVTLADWVTTPLGDMIAA